MRQGVCWGFVRVDLGTRGYEYCVKQWDKEYSVLNQYCNNNCNKDVYCMLK